MRAAYVDCFSGVSGDMLLGALVDAGAPLNELLDGLRSLPVDGWSIVPTKTQRQGVSGTRLAVEVAQAGQPHRLLGEVLRLVRGGNLPAEVVEKAIAVFNLLGEAEAHVHGLPLDEVELHEVGAVDSILDVCGGVLALHLLGVERVYCSGLTLGSGWVRSQHGPLPVPGPATLEIVRRVGAPTRRPPRDEPVGELTTPTGAALLGALAEFRDPAFARVETIGYGFGQRELPWPNATRVWLGPDSDPSLPDGVRRERVVQIETHVDDSTPEELGFALERLLDAGALDVGFLPLQMKKNRPGVLVRVLGRQGDGDRLAQALLRHTSALGARVQEMERLVLERATRQVETPWGPVRVKETRVNGQTRCTPEYDDCASAARAAGVPLRAVYQAALAAAGSGAEQV